MNKPKPIRLKYIPTDMYAVRYFKEKPFIVQDGMSFGYSKNIDFRNINLDFSQVKIYNGSTGSVQIFDSTTNCYFDLNKLNKYDYFINSYSPFQNSKNPQFEGEFLRSGLQYLFALKFDYTVGKKELDKISSLIENLKFTYNPTDSEKTGRIYSRYIFMGLEYTGAKLINKLNNSTSSATYFPKVDMSKWDFENFHLYGGIWFHNAYIFSLILPESENFYRDTDKIFENGFKLICKIYNFNFKLFYNEFQDSYANYHPRSYVFFGKNLGWKSDKTKYYLNFRFTETGTILQDYNGEYMDEVNGEESLRSMRYTLIEQSFDRKSAGYSTCTLYLRTETENLLTTEEIAQITAKGFSLIFNLT